MPPLDTGSVVHTLRLVDPLVDRAEPEPANFPTIGAYLRAVRERRGRSLVDLANATRIRRAYLSAIEDGDYAALPSRPFATGYVRAYGAALDVDGEAAAERFKTEFPAHAEALRAPIGIKHDRPERRPLFVLAALGVVGAVVAWNIIQRATVVEKDAGPPPVPAVVEEAAPVPAQQGPIALGAPTPPPAEQTTPAPYVTPGLGGSVPSTADPTAKRPVVTGAVAPAAAITAPVRFEAHGEVYGAPAGGPAVVLQARKPGSLIVRGPAGEVYFARQLKAGEAYRAPLGRKLSAEVSDPNGFSIYINDQLRGALLINQTPLDKVAVEIVAHAPTE